MGQRARTEALATEFVWPGPRLALSETLRTLTAPRAG